MAIDWTLLVAECTPEKPENPGFYPLFPQKVGTEQGGVGTDFDSQHIEKNELFYAVPTVPTVPTLFERAEVREHENNSPSSFIEPAGGEVQRQSAPHKTPAETRSCKTCAQRCRPGLSEGYCSTRHDLPPAYGHGHPLHQLPADGGAGCPAWRLHPAW